MKQLLRSVFYILVMVVGLMATHAHAQSMGATQPMDQAPRQKAAKEAATASNGIQKQSAAEAPRAVFLYAPDDDKPTTVVMEELKNFKGVNVSPMEGKGLYLLKAEKPETLVRLRAAYPELLFLTGRQLYALSETFQQTPQLAKAALRLAEQN